jgi:hypothetical protein
MSNQFLVWSNEHRMWWRANERGYTDSIEEAGRYSRREAEQIVASATLGGELAQRRVDPVTEREYAQMSEVLVLAPEASIRTAPTVRFGLAVDSDNGAHVRFRLFAATGGQHLGGCGNLVMRTDEYAAFRALLAPALTDRSDPETDEAVTAR